MSTKKLFLFVCILFSFITFAQTATPPIGEVVKIHGKVLFQNNEVKLGDVISKPGKIEVLDKSFIQIKIDKWKNLISIGGNSTMNLNFSDEKKYSLESGECRWKSFAKSESKGKIFTKNVAMGVRGTDFLLMFNPHLNETEIIMFDGAVLFENLDDKENNYEVKKGQWGGLGGRFGNKINPPLNLSKEVLDQMEKKVE